VDRPRVTSLPARTISMIGNSGRDLLRAQQSR
jgi:hypothetical protein